MQSEGYSVAEVTAGSTDGWSSATGRLRCGLGPEDTSVMQILDGKLAAAGTLTVRHMTEYLDT